MRLRKKRVLITGAKGFIGSMLVRRCIREDADTYILIPSKVNNWRIADILPKVGVHYGDLLDLVSLEKVISSVKPEIIFHLAAYGVYPDQKETVKIININFSGTKNLLDVCGKIKYQLFVNTGSIFEYGIKHHPLKESDSLEPVTDYGVSKAAATLYCHALARRENKPIVTLRLSTPYGSYEEPPRLIPSVILSFLNNKAPKLTSSKFVRDFLFIDDVIEAYIKVVENVNKVKGEIFNIGYGKQHTIGEIADIILELTGTKMRPEWGSPSRYRIESNMWQPNISKAKRLLGWMPKYTLKQGLTRTVLWFSENKELYKNSV